MWRGAFLNAPIDFRQMRMQSHTGCISLEWRTTLSLSTHFTRIPPPPLLLRLEIAPWVVSPDVDLFKWCQKKRITKGYHLKLYFLSQDASQVSEKPKQRCPSRSRFGADCSGISGSPCYHCNFGFICPSHLKYHMKRIATKEKVLSLFISRLVRAWRCRALMWVFISIQIDPVIIFSQDFLLQLLRLRT